MVFLYTNIRKLLLFHSSWSMALTMSFHNKFFIFLLSASHEAYSHLSVQCPPQAPVLATVQAVVGLCCFWHKKDQILDLN